MPRRTITAVNVSSPSVDVYIEDMGNIKIPASGSLLLSDISREEEIVESIDLKQSVNDDDIVLDLGSGSLTKTQSLNLLNGYSFLADTIGKALDAADSPDETNPIATISDIPENLADLDDMTQNYADAITNANAPTSSNPFLTEADISNGKGSDMTMHFGLEGSLDNVYLQVAGGSKVTSDESTIGFPRAIKIIGYYLDSSYHSSRTWNVRIKEKSNLAVNKATIFKASGSYFQYYYDESSSLTTFSAGQRMSVFVDKVSGKANDPKITFWFRWND